MQEVIEHANLIYLWIVFFTMFSSTTEEVRVAVMV